jgi:gluconolactonase
VVAAGTKVVVVKDGFQSTEGPVPLPDGSLLFTEPGASRVHKIDKNDNISTFLENTKRANGLAFDSKQRLVAVQALTVDVIYPKGSETTLAGPLPARPNDLVVDKKDGVFFTLPGATPPGVYYIPVGGKPSFIAEVASPHGIQLSPDEKTLYVADINNEYLVAFDVQADGKITNRRNFGKYEGVKKTETGFDTEADGLAVDSEGRIYVGTTPGVQVFSPKGQNLGVIPTSQRSQNLAFAGPDKKTLYLTGRSALFKVQMLSQGYRGRPK